MFFEIKEKPYGATSGAPIFNEILIPYHSGIYAQRKFNIKLLVEWIQKTPEALGIIRAMANDIVTKISFKAVDKKKTGRPSNKDPQERVLRAEMFAAQQRIKEIQLANAIDWFMTGDFYTWIGMFTDEQIKELVKKVYISRGLEFKESEFKIRDFLDEDAQRIKSINYAASETVEIDYTEEEILGYVQTTYSSFTAQNQLISPNLSVGAKRRYWEPEQIIHGKFMEMSGKVYGFTPMYADSSVIRTLGLIKDYIGMWFEKGGIPDFMFMFESMGFTNKQNIDALKESLQAYNAGAQLRGNFVGETTGKFQAIQLNKFDKDLEFRQLMIMYAGVLAFSVGFPSTRLKAIIGSDIKGSTGETDAETDAYERNLENMQDYILGLWNTQFWIPYFGVEQKFSRGYRQNEIREVQRDTQKAAYINSLAKGVKIKLSESYIKEYLGLNDEDVDEIEYSSLEEQSLAAKGILPNNKVLKGQASQAYQEEKRKQAPTDKNKQIGS